MEETPQNKSHEQVFSYHYGRETTLRSIVSVFLLKDTI